MNDRNETPLYFDHQASTPVDPAVVAAMAPYFSDLFGNPHSTEHSFGHHAHEAVETARSQVAAAISAESEDITFTSGATEANNLAILGIARSEPLRDRDTILVSAIEHSSVLEAAHHSGLRVVTIRVTHEGVLDRAHFDAHLTEQVRLVSFGAVNNEIGVVQDIEALGSAAHEVGALVHVDAAQALMATDFNVSRMPVDFVSLSSHKAYGPKGIGALYVPPDRARLLKPLIYGGGQERGLRAGTLPTPLCVGFGAACLILRSKGADERARIEKLRENLYSRLKTLHAEIRLVGPTTIRHPGSLSVLLPVSDARDVLQLVQSQLACSTGSACHSGTELPSHVLLAIGMPVSEARRVLRLGVGRFTTEHDCNRAAEILAEAIDRCNV